MKEHLRNALFGVLDYAAYPAGMIVLAPLILHQLGMARFGIWAMANAAWNTGAVLASGFGDANIRAVADARAEGDWNRIILSVRSALGLHLVVGVVIAALAFVLAPWIARSATVSIPSIQSDCRWSLRIAAILMLLRSIETVCVGTQRAFARYGYAIQVSLVARLLALAAAWCVPMIAASVHAVMLATLAIGAAAVSVQLRQLRKLLRVARLSPLFEPSKAKKLAAFGIYSWIQSVAGLLLGQVDRLIAGVSFGAAAVTSYTLCVQLAQPIYGLCASGLHFIFPYLASQSASRQDLRRPVGKALAANISFAGTMLVILLIRGDTILTAWMGSRVAAEAAALLAPVAWSSALCAMSVTGGYALLALNKPRTLTAFNLLGSAATLIAIPWLIPRLGIQGLAYARLMFGPAVLLAYIPLFMDSRRSTSNQRKGAAWKCAKT